MLLVWPGQVCCCGDALLEMVFLLFGAVCHHYRYIDFWSRLINLLCWGNLNATPRLCMCVRVCVDFCVCACVPGWVSLCVDEYVCVAGHLCFSGWICLCVCVCVCTYLSVCFVCSHVYQSVPVRAALCVCPSVCQSVCVCVCVCMSWCLSARNMLGWIMNMNIDRDVFKYPYCCWRVCVCVCVCVFV